MASPKDKKKFLLWAFPSTLDLVKNNYKKAHCRSQSEFIERAIQYYVGYINADDDTSYLPNAVLSNLRAIVRDSDTRIGRVLFKLAVEMSVLMNIVAAQYDIDPLTLSRLRGACVGEVKRINGGLKMEDAVAWQRGDEE